MRTLIFGKRENNIREIIKNFGFEIVEDNPELVISYGGDGTFMRSETFFPSILKLILRDSHVCKLCSKLSNEEVLDYVKNKKYEIVNIQKLEAIVGKKKILGINDIVLHNADVRHAVRYKIYINNEQFGGEIIGDGIIVATPLGSTGYYRSITDSFFEVGIGLAFNNSTEQSDHIVLKNNSIIKVIITRGPAVLYSDNNKESIALEKGSDVIIKLSEKKAKIIRIKTK